MGDQRTWRRLEFGLRSVGQLDYSLGLASNQTGATSIIKKKSREKSQLQEDIFDKATNIIFRWFV